MRKKGRGRNWKTGQAGEGIAWEKEGEFLAPKVGGLLYGKES